ncbi:putative dolichyl-diphosphooligosaccharide--protein glycosyltransferase subunit 3B [Raphanus sativus]|uniref:Probable dolichyl-diphosphooligosaccharide--protein glycosyltransferase subunit 3B n=1 Tax=Raphanus sativus TaxID=3726 RepID=A0A6J0K1L3_RAPSA|nr:probable dolichyl-diphosphooligosaccharide--protein glycosyltransferase subunit 3B [Raphanus sativus]KAJ4887290.1 putative dolichyl-diphosphooligosaccharide--protein glycosyltransferase subunit 3B [Raphanus sativus]
MAINKKLLSLLLLVSSLSSIALSSSSFSDPDSDSDLTNELVSLRSNSESGVIHLDDHGISKFLISSPTPRPYSILVFFDATQLHSKTELRLQELRREFHLLSATFLAANNNGSDLNKLFFCEIEFSQSQSSFKRFNVNALPHIRLVTASTSKLTDESGQMDQSDFSRLAESMAEFVEQRTKLTVGPIQRPPLLSKPQISVIVAMIVVAAPFVVKRILRGETLLHDHRLWLSGAIFVYFFSVAGTMHNIIRKMPMFLQDRNDPNKLVFFYQGSGMQLGAEGFAVGFLYTVVGLLLAFVTNVLVRVGNVNVQRLVMLVALVVSSWAVKQVVYLDNWKTGYGIHPYWPSSWQ